MKKTFMSLVLLAFINTISQSSGSDAALNYLRSGSTPPPLPGSPSTCSGYCSTDTCLTDLNSKQYRCFFACSHERNTRKSVDCVSKQFPAYVNDLHAQIKQLIVTNGAQTQAISSLQSQLKLSKQNLQKQGNRLKNATASNEQQRNQLATLAQNFTELQNKYNSDQQKILILTQVNTKLTEQLSKANEVINTQAINIADLNKLVEANQKEIDGLKQELDDASLILEELIRQFDAFVGQVGDVTGLFRDQTKAIRDLDGQLLNRIRGFKAYMEAHRDELVPYIQQNQREFAEFLESENRNIRELQDFIRSSQEMLDTARQQVGDVVRRFNEVRESQQ